MKTISYKRAVEASVRYLPLDFTKVTVMQTTYLPITLTLSDLFKKDLMSVASDLKREYLKKECYERRKTTTKIYLSKRSK